MVIKKAKNSTKNSNSIIGIEDVKLIGSSNQPKKGSSLCCPCCCIPCCDPCFTCEIFCVLAICRIFCCSPKRSCCNSDNCHYHFLPVSI